MKANSTDKILLKLHRQYSKDETVSLQKEKIVELQKLLKQSKIENGVIKSELHESQHNLIECEKTLSKELINRQQRQNECDVLRKKQSNFDKAVHKATKDIHKSLRKAISDSRDWAQKYFDLKVKTKKNEI